MVAVFISALIFLSGGCGSSASSAPPVAAAEFTIDVRLAGERLYRDLEYRDSLEELDPLIVYTLLGIDPDDVIEIMNYFSSGATAEEIIVLKASGSEALESLKAIIVERIEDQKNVYVSYAPEEVNYLKGAVVEVKGDYLLYCVPADGAAGKKLVGEIIAEAGRDKAK